MAHARDLEYNASPFYLNADAVAQAWEHVRAWIPVKGGTHYPEAADRWRKRPATKAARERGVRPFVRSEACKERYVAEAIAYIHRKRLHVEMDSYEEYEKEVMLEVALQLVILKHERLADMDTAAALVARRLPMADRTYTKDRIASDPEYWWSHPDTTFDDGAAVREWWDRQAQRSVFYALGTSGESTKEMIRHAFFGDAGHMDPLAHDHVRMLRLVPQLTPWKLEVSGAHGAAPRTCACPVHNVDPFCLTATLDTGEEVELFPESTDVWSGFTANRETVELHMDDAYNIGIILTFDRHVPDEETALFASLPDDEDATEEVNNRPETDVEDNGNDRMVMAVSPTLDDENQ